MVKVKEPNKFVSELIREIDEIRYEIEANYRSKDNVLTTGIKIRNGNYYQFKDRLGKNFQN